MIFDITKIEYFFIVLELNKVEYFFFYFLFCTKLLLILSSTACDRCIHQTKYNV